jgi:hypothetical protein
VVLPDPPVELEEELPERVLGAWLPVHRHTANVVGARRDRFPR